MKTLINFFKSIWNYFKILFQKTEKYHYPEDDLPSFQKPKWSMLFRKQQLSGKLYLSFGKWYRVEKLIGKNQKGLRYEITQL